MHFGIEVATFWSVHCTLLNHIVITMQQEFVVECVPLIIACICYILRGHTSLVQCVFAMKCRLNVSWAAGIFCGHN